MDIISWKANCLNFASILHASNPCRDLNPLEETYLNEANKLDGSNFINWKFKMQTLMEGYGIWMIVKGDEVKPNVAVGATAAQNQDWDKRENKAKVLMHMSIKDSIITHIREGKTFAETWTVLKDLC